MTAFVFTNLVSFWNLRRHGCQIRRPASSRRYVFLRANRVRERESNGDANDQRFHVAEIAICATLSVTTLVNEKRTRFLKHLFEFAAVIFETRSLPTLTRSYPRHFTFYLGNPFELGRVPAISPLPSRFHLLCRASARSIPRLKLARCRSLAPNPCHFYVDHSHYLVLAPATLATLPSTRAIETRSLPTSLAATPRGFAFHVAFPKSSIPSIATCSMLGTP